MIPLAAGIGAASVIGNVAGGLFGANAAKKAARAQAEAMQQGIDYQKQIYGETKNNINPWITAGTEGLADYTAGVDNMVQPTMDYQQEDFAFDKWEDPGAKYQMQQAALAMDAVGAAKGAQGGGLLRAINADQADKANTAYSGAYDRWLKNSNLKYTQASEQYDRDATFQNNQLDRYKGISDTGLQGASALGQIGAGTANSISDLFSGIGSAKASGAVGAGKSYTNMLSGIGSSLTTPYGSDKRTLLEDLLSGIGG